MKIKCTYCRAEINDYDEKCPNCGGQNHNLKRVGNEVPQTIEELKQWYQDMNLPPEEVTRFFIGKLYSSVITQAIIPGIKCICLIQLESTTS